MDRPGDLEDWRAVGSDEGGDEACWLRRVCPECGRLHGPDPPDVCELCGADMPE